MATVGMKLDGIKKIITTRMRWTRHKLQSVMEIWGKESAQIKSFAHSGDKSFPLQRRMVKSR